MGISLGVCSTLILQIAWEAAGHAWELPDHVEAHIKRVLSHFHVTWLVVCIFLVASIPGIWRYRGQWPPERFIAIALTWILAHALLGVPVGLLALDLYETDIRSSHFFVIHNAEAVVAVLAGISVGCLLGLVIRPGPTVSHHLMYGAATGLGVALCLLFVQGLVESLSQFDVHVYPIWAFAPLSSVGPIVGGLLGAVAARYQDHHHVRIPSLTWMGFGSLLGWLVGLGLGQAFDTVGSIGTQGWVVNAEIVLAGALFGIACVAVIRWWCRRKSQKDYAGQGEMKTA
jgi:hypothetical protein